MADEKRGKPKPVADVPPPGEKTWESPARPPGKRRRLLLALPLIVVGGAYGGYWYVWSLTHERTDDAQTEGHIHAVSSKVSGYVAEVWVRDNQVVAKGEVLVRIRLEDYQARVRLAEAKLAQAEADLKTAEHNVAVLQGTTAAAIAEARAGVRQEEARLEGTRKDADSAQAKLAAAIAAREQAQAQVKAAQADFDYASYNLGRISALREQNQAAEDEAQLAEAQCRAAEAKLSAANESVNLSAAQINAAQNALAAAQAAIVVAEAAIDKQKGKLEDALTGPDQVRVAEARLELARGGVLAARAQLDLARLELGYCTITTPADGVISKRSVEVGQYLQPGQSFLAVVPLDDTWVVANFKETHLRNMRVGQPARLQVDAYPDHLFRGHVESVAAGTGARFSILPPENATGNFVKVVQRVPVKIVLDDGERDPQRPLRPGMNVVVTVDTSERASAAASAP
ncbi:MAG TPA: HlyD family secretion protein [Phycisphaerae bacterium]|nr:HlyD family secretion protein [Phycisphaerae bacterium]